MINTHQFQQAAKKFRAGRITLKEFTDLVFDGKPTRKPNEESAAAIPQSETKAETVQAERSDGDAGESTDQFLVKIPERIKEAHKGDFGRVLAIGGAEGMAGAISLTGLAALRTGSGLVRVAVPEMIQALVAALHPCLMTFGCPSEGDFFHGDALEALGQQCEWADVIALGPGMGRGGAQQWIVKKLYAEVPQPIVVDADGLNALADEVFDLSVHAGQRILTPHPGEFQRLTQTKFTNRSDLEQAATEMAKAERVVVVLKGNQTFVTDGVHEYRNDTGNPGMATAGSGDVLTGMITSLIGQGLGAFQASCLGVYLHGVAGDFAAESKGQTSLIATDLIELVPAAIKSHSNQGSQKIGF